ncbi:MAG: hypothetical protein NC548_26435 [Lachnospiraceae bacterium]|nr:hypothetical protein [Lachnospiraceae bacterium]
MTVSLFVTILTAGAAVNALLTEAVKKAYENAGRKCSPNMVALIDAVVVGGLGTAAVYMLMGIPWSVNNIICLVMIIAAVWIASMVGYDKILQMVRQIEGMGLSTEEEKGEADNGDDETD